MIKKIKTGEDETVNEIHKYFADTGPSLTKNIPNLSMSFQNFTNKRIEKCIFFSLNTKKCPGAINVNVIIHSFVEFVVLSNTYLIHHYRVGYFQT